MSGEVRPLLKAGCPSIAPRVVMSDRRGQYRLGREIGRGAMAVVYEAEHVALGKRAAVKTLHAPLAGNEQSEARFAREARIAAMLRHPHVAEVYDYGVAEHGPYLVLELAERGNFASLLKVRGPLPLPLALELLLPIASGLDHAHERGVVHRDMKPANILLADDRSGGLVPKICDFGIGKSGTPGEERLTADGAILGTLAYMPPEQLRDPSSAGPAADQYALAAILYEAITGRLVYESAPTLEWIHLILAGGAAPPSRFRPDLPAALDDVVLRALQVEPDVRFPSVVAFAAELLRFASGRTWTTWAREFGASRAAECSTADDDLRGQQGFAAPTPPPPLPPGRKRWVRWGLGAASTFALGFAMSNAVREEVPARAIVTSTKASNGAAQYVVTRDVLGGGIGDAGARVDLAAPSPPATRATTAPTQNNHDAQAASSAPSPASTGNSNVHSYGSNRAPILE